MIKRHQGDMIRFARQRAKLSQEQLGKRLPMSRQTISIYERTGHIPPEVFEQILRELNVTYSQLERQIMEYGPATMIASDGQENYTAWKKREEELLQQIERQEKITKYLEERIVSLEHAFAQAMEELMKLRALQG